MRALTCGLLGCIALAVGCSASSPSAPAGGNVTPATPAGGSRLGGAVVHGDLTEAALARWVIQVDPGTLQASSTLAERHASQTDDLYLLDVSNFLKSDSLRVDSVTETATTLDLAVRFTHPFRAPADLDAPPTAANRADLGISARLTLLLDVPTSAGNTYFTGDGPAIANTTLIENADGYCAPAGLLDGTSLTANTFPYFLVVDEAEDNRDGVSNGGVGTGNYNATGWQRDNMGPARDGWTGNDVLHQGQSAVTTVSINKAALAGGETLNFDAVVLAKYEDPRGGTNSATKRSNRLPANPADVLRFVYRFPHGALDVSQIEELGETGGFIANTISASTINLRVRDWDARATDTTATDLSADPVVSNVEPGESGLPTVALSIPDVLGTNAVETFVNGTDLKDDDSAFGGDVSADTGAALDGLFYSRSVTKNLLSGQTGGTYTGLLRVTDVEDTLDTSGWQTPLSGDLQPITGPAPRPVTYQRI
ncbi:MAG: hypothetical protein ABI743_13485, partial [bacterium]